eukprot:TRINITY_DN31555_c0_g1_i2.p1 TRINITY_DN31555_c0_g1~~TRINITY_DN31555_c0_g1_i2.p1  ORF type:complete len:262 (-),score=31.79 TRINITY_DN31555_c0_g1_i2:234-1019(-)
MLWLAALVAYAVLIWAAKEFIAPWRDGTTLGTIWFNAGMMSMQVAFLCIRGAFCYGSEEQFIGLISKDMGTLWRFSYKAQMSNFTMMMFPILSPGTWTTPLLAALLMTSVLAFKLYWIQRTSKKAVDELIKIAFCIFADTFAAANFLIIFTFIGIGPNKKHMYILEDLSDEEVSSGILKIVCVILGKVVEGCALWYMASRKFTPEDLRHVTNFFVVTINDWYWIIWTILVSSSLTCGACMVMKHDGMDLSLKFSEWSGAVI